MLGLQNRLRDRLDAAQQHYDSCQLCEHRCGVRRNVGERGVCKATDAARVFRHRVEYGEELEIIPSHLFYLSGCDLRCAFCIAGANAFDPQRGEDLTTELFRSAVAWGIEQGSRTLQWVGGEPTIHLPRILQVMSECDALPPIVWKSDFYGTPDAFRLLDGLVDTYIADFKFGNDACAQRIASVDNYVAIITRNLQLAARQGNLIVRHLLLPGHFECCFAPIVQQLQRVLPGVKFSLRDGYLPKWRAGQFSELSRRLPAGEGSRAARFAREHGINLL